MEKYRLDAPDETITITISKAEALVLDNLLDRWWTNLKEGASFQIEHDAEWHALNRIGGSIETQLVELFMPGYSARVEDARQQLVERWGKLEK